MIHYILSVVRRVERDYVLPVANRVNLDYLLPITGFGGAVLLLYLLSVV